VDDRPPPPSGRTAIACRAAVAVAVAVLLVATMLASACGDSAANDDKLSVVATTPILAALAQRVTGDAASVTSLIPGGTDPHAYEASAQERRRIVGADLLVVNGADLEEGLVTVLDEATGEGVPTFIAMDAVDPLRYATGEPDPHFWHDPRQTAAVATAMADTLAEVDADNADAYQGGAARFREDLDELAEEVEAILQPLATEQRLLVTNHDAYQYFAARFGFEVLGTIVPGRSTEATPSPTRIAELAALTRDRDVCAVFAEEEGSTAVAESLATEAGPDVEVVTLFAGTLPDGYEDLLRENATRFADALSRCG
jgi:zinc/manganese transport system substrate-binding protein